MSESIVTQPTEQPIVVHGPLTGDADRLAAVPVVPPPPAVPVARAVAPAAPSVAPRVESVVGTERMFGLDAWRGLLLLAMNFSFTIPDWGPFPAWMYHMQVPPGQPSVYVNQAGLTWRDMVYPGFLFTMAAALPIAMSARLAKGIPYPRIAWLAVRRGAMLLLFAMLIGHVNPFWTKDYSKTGNIAAILGVLVSFALFVQPPQASERTRTWLRRVAWAGVVTILVVVPSWYGQRFSPDRQDSVIASVAFLTVVGTAIWLATRTRPIIRLAVLAAVVAGRLMAGQVGALGEVWWSTPASWLYQPWYLELLLIVIPGTIVGDLLVQWMRQRADGPLQWSGRRLTVLAALGLTVIPVLAVGLYERRYPLETTAAIVAVCAVAMYLVRKPLSARDYVLTRLWAWAAACLVVGMLVEPLQGGMRKDPQTFSYLIVMTGMSIAALTSLVIILDAFGHRARALRPLAEIGQNALFAYVVFFLGILHVMWLFGVGDAFTATWQQALLRSVALTALVGGIVWLTTKKRLLWRA